MPYESLAQERYFNANRGKLEAQGVDVDEWNAASKGKKLHARKENKVAEEKKEHREVRKIEIEPSENGGFTVTHHNKPKMSKDSKAHSGMSIGYEEPEHHVFGKGEGHEMLAHVANHLGIDEKDGEENEDGVGKDGAED
jgi:hypothetical protein